MVRGHSGRGASQRLYASAEIYVPSAAAFRAAGEMTIRRHKHDAVLLLAGRVLITGGSDERDDRGLYASAEIYEPSSGSFRPAGRMRLPRYKHGGTSWC